MFLYPRFALHLESGGLSVLTWSVLVWVNLMAGAEDGGTIWMSSVCVFLFVFVLFGSFFWTASFRLYDLDGYITARSAGYPLCLHGRFWWSGGVWYFGSS